MAKKNYIFSLIETKNDRAYSKYLSGPKALLLILGILSFFIVLSFPISNLIIKSADAFKINHLKNENTLLKSKFKSWEARTDSIKQLMKELQQMNNQINQLSRSSFQLEKLGVGGPETSSLIINLNYPKIIKTELEIDKIEQSINILKNDMAEIIAQITSRMKHISHLPSIRPVRQGWLSSAFGKRHDPFTNKIVDHPGIDICTNIGTKIYAPATGKICAIRKDFIKNKGYGKFIIIDHGYGNKTIYGHLSKILVKKGQKVKRWDVIGLTGNSGKSTSPHLHYGVILNGEPQNPLNFILE